MPDQINVEELIQQHSTEMAKRMNEAAQWANSEEDVRHEVGKLIDAFLKDAGIKERGRHEYGLAGGRVDSKYGGVIIEYKSPKGTGRIRLRRDAPGTVAVVQQIRQRFKDFQRDEHIEPDRLFAVGCDGSTLVYVRHRSGRFEVEDPQPVTSHTVERLLRALLSLGARGASFTPDRLAERFGADGKVARNGVRDIYAVITATASPKAKTFFQQWKILFGEVCGYDVEGKNDKIKKLGTHYGLPTAQPAELLFSVHTYYAIFMKLLAAEIASTFTPLGISALKRCVQAPTSAKLLAEIRYLEEGGIWKDLGITNFLEGDLFSWYLAAWDEKTEGVVRAIVTALDDFDPTTLSVEPTESRDLLKKLYQQLFPKSVRHDLGEYYTPDWLAEYVLEQLDYDGNPDKRLLDPACGSGTFLVMSINRIRAWFRDHRHDCGYDEAGLVSRIMRNVIGFDLNPLAVMAARTNYLMAVRDLLRFAGGVELPVYLCDSVVTPSEYGALFTPGDEAVAAVGRAKELKTAAASFRVPAEVTGSGENIGKYADVIENCVKGRYTADQFIELCKAEGLPTSEEALHRELFDNLLELDAKNQNGIWARIIKNAFAPLFLEKVDYVAGNPPWVNWESLPGQYRDDMKPLWERYGLFSLTKAQGRLGGGKKDLSMLFVYSCVDNYLAVGGKLGFVITQTVFKTKGAGDGFRGLSYKFNGMDTVYLAPVSVTDMSDLQPFEAATNRTAVFVCRKSNEPFSYPVPYQVWTKAKRTSLYSNIDSKLDADGSRPLIAFNAAEDLTEVRQAVNAVRMAAIPVTPSHVASPWLTVPTAALPGVKKVLEPSDYSAHAGVNTGGLNGCYWIRRLGPTLDGAELIANLYDVGKIKVERVECAIEPDLIYPLLRGRDVQRWSAQPSAHIILAQDPETRTGIKEDVMKVKMPKTYAYLKRFESQLRKRAAFRKYFDGKDAFYSMYNVGTYTLAPYKVMWRDMGTRIQVAVVGSVDGRPVCPEHHAMAVSLSDTKEAHFLCAALMSSTVQLIVAGYTTTTGMSTHILEHVAIPRYSASNPLHVHLAELSEQCHEAAAHGYKERLTALEADVDKAAAELWGITDSELRNTWDALAGITAAEPSAGASPDDEAED